MVIEHLRMDPRMKNSADLLETSLEDLRTEILDRLKNFKESVPPASGNVARIYLMYDRRDTATIAPWADYLFERGLEVIQPMFEGDEAEIREFHEDNLRTCEGVLIFYGAANECWLRRKLSELRKSAGYGRVNPLRKVAIVQIAPRSPEKERFKTHEAEIIPQWEGFSPDRLASFVSGCLPPDPESAFVRSNSSDESTQTPWIGRKLGPYEIVARLGAGGMGEVYRARDHRLDCDVAIKILRSGPLANEDAQRRFSEEGRALARLRYSQHIAVIHDIGQEAGVNYLVMEYVPGETLTSSWRLSTDSSKTCA